MTSSLFESSKVVPNEITPLGLSFAGPVPQGKKKKTTKSSRSVFSQVIVSILLVCIGFKAYSSLSSSASSAIVDQSLSKSVNNQDYGNDSNVFPTVSLVESETQTQTTLKEVTTGATTELSDQPATFTLQFPKPIRDDVFKKGDTDPEELDNISTMCNHALYETIKDTGHPSYTRELLGCHIYDDNNDDIVPIFLGTLNKNADVLKVVTDMDIIDASMVSSLFHTKAFATMINNNCFVWNSEQTIATYSKTQYDSETSYSNQFSKKTGIAVSASASYAGISVKAGYKQSHIDSGESDGTMTTAYGQAKYSGQVGVLTNVCFDDHETFAEHKIADLVNFDYWGECWNAIRNATTIEALLAQHECVTKVANGGFEMPLQYIYSVGTTNTYTTQYKSSSTKQAHGASDKISASLSGSFGGAGASVSTSVSSTNSASQTNKAFSGTVTHTSKSIGTDVNLSCLSAHDCDNSIAVAVAKIRNDYSTLGSPSSLGKKFISLDQILKFYFGTPDYGLPDAFVPAYEALENLNAYYYNKPGTVCWAYDFEPSSWCKGVFNNNKNCWTTDQSIMPASVSFSPLILNDSDTMEAVGMIISPKPEVCCNQCEMPVWRVSSPPMEFNNFAAIKQHYYSFGGQLNLDCDTSCKDEVPEYINVCPTITLGDVPKSQCS